MNTSEGLLRQLIPVAMTLHFKIQVKPSYTYLNVFFLKKKLFIRCLTGYRIPLWKTKLFIKVLTFLNLLKVKKVNRLTEQ